MNADEFAAIRARHPRDRHDCPSCDEYVCSRGPWEVCDAARLVSEVERLRGIVEERDREIERMVLRYGMRQRAALGGEDG